MTDPTEAGEAGETVLGLDPRALLGSFLEDSETSARLRAWSPPAFAEVARRLPQYTILGLLGRGGMGAVYRARSPDASGPLAIKLLPPDAAADAVFAERFRNEAETMSLLRHPHIVAVHAHGRTDDGYLYIVMEEVVGSDLAALMAAGPLPTARALDIARVVCSALAYAHDRGVIHRDIKPANVLIGDDGTVKVADFGLACLQQQRVGSAVSRLTVAGQTVGTPDYMAPEQRAGRDVDGRADLYSLGVMLYEMLAGELPQGAWRPPTHRGRSDSKLDAVVEKSLQHDPARRPQSAGEMLGRLDRLHEAPAFSPQRRRLVAAAAGGLVVASAGGSWWWRQSRRPAEAPVAGAGGAGDDGSKLLSPAGRCLPLVGLDLTTAAASGHWQWSGDPAEGVLTIAYTPDQPLAKRLELPVCPGPRTYELRADIWLDHRGSGLNIVFPAGNGRAALVLDLYDFSGFEYIRGADWKTNVTSLFRLLPTGRFLPLILGVRPAGGLVTLTAQIDHQTQLSWEGEQADLGLDATEYPPETVNPRSPGITLLSNHGGVRVRSVQVDISPS